MKKYIVCVVVLCSLLNMNGMEVADKGSELFGVVVDSASNSYSEAGKNLSSVASRRDGKLEPKSLIEVRQIVREHSSRNGLPARKKIDPQSGSGVTERSQGTIVGSTSDSVMTSSRKSTPRKFKNFMSPKRPSEELKNSRGEAKVVPRSVSDVQRIVKNRSARSEPAPRLAKRSVPVFSREQLEQVHQNRYSKKMYTQEEVQHMIEIRDQQRKAHESKVLYTEEEVAEILQQASHSVTPLISSRFREYGQQYNVPLQELPQYAQLLDDIVITPRLLAEFVYKRHGTDKEPKSYEVNRYEKLSKSNPAQYEKLVFGLLKELLADDQSDDGANNQLPSVFVDTHVRLLQDEIGSQKDDVYQRTMAALTMVVGWLLTGAGWIIQSQLSSSTSPSIGVNGTHTG